MKAEEYIESVGNTVVNGKTIVKSDFLPKRIAFKAVEIARKEEREKAVKAFKKVISECGSKCESVCSYSCNDECLIGKFKKLLNGNHGI